MTSHSNPSQTDQVLAYMRAHGGITSRQAYDDLGVTRLSARIANLKDRGLEIKAERVKARNRYGLPVSFNKYYVMEDV